MPTRSNQPPLPPLVGRSASRDAVSTGQRHGDMAMAGQATSGLRLPGSRRHYWVGLAMGCWSVGVAGGVVDAAAGCPPGNVAGFGLGEVPGSGLLASVVMPAERGEVAFAGEAPEVGSLHNRAWQPRSSARSLS